MAGKASCLHPRHKRLDMRELALANEYHSNGILFVRSCHLFWTFGNVTITTVRQMSQVAPIVKRSLV